MEKKIVIDKNFNSSKKESKFISSVKRTTIPKKLRGSSRFKSVKPVSKKK